MEIAWYKLIAGFMVHRFFPLFFPSLATSPLPPIPSTTTTPFFCKGQKQLSVIGKTTALQKCHRFHEPLERAILSSVPKPTRLGLIPETFLAIS